MAVPTPRALFACAIPTIIVILSYFWFRKKEARTPDKPHRLPQKKQQSRSSLANNSAAVAQLSNGSGPVAADPVRKVSSSDCNGSSSGIGSVSSETDISRPLQSDFNVSGQPAATAVSSSTDEKVGVPEFADSAIIDVIFDQRSPVSSSHSLQANCSVEMAGLKDDDDDCSGSDGGAAAARMVVVDHDDGVVDRALRCVEASSACSSTGEEKIEEEEEEENIVEVVETCRESVERLAVDETTANNSVAEVDSSQRRPEFDVGASDGGEREKFCATSTGSDGACPKLDVASHETEDVDVQPKDGDSSGDFKNGVDDHDEVDDDDDDDPAEETILAVDDEFGGGSSLDVSVEAMVAAMAESVLCPSLLADDAEAVVVERDASGTVEVSSHETSSSGLSVDEPELRKLSSVVGGGGDSGEVGNNGMNTSAYGSASHSPAEDLLDSPTASTYSDLHSEGSSDSGKGGSDIHTPGNGESCSSSGGGGGVGGSSSTNFSFSTQQIYEYEIPQLLCGRLIGQQGNYVNQIKTKTKANISIKAHPYDPLLKICAIIGTEEDISAALVMIRKRFPLNRYPNMNLMQVNGPISNGITVPETLQLQLPDGVSCDVILSSLVNAGHFFVQQPTHPTHPSLSCLDQCMLNCYLDGTGAPKVPPPIELGIICAAATMGGWYRAQVVYLYPDTEFCDLKFVDYGGYTRESTSSLRQIRSDFMTLPFQASECFLADVVPIEESEGWSPEATSFFEEMAQGQILQTQIVGYSEEGIPHVHLYRVQGVTTTFINREMVTYGFARWVNAEA